jgi:hypothetical protein
VTAGVGVASIPARLVQRFPVDATAVSCYSEGALMRTGGRQMTRRLLVGMALMMVVVTGVTLAPRQARATDNLVYIIPAALGGAVMVVVVIAILISEHKAEPELDLVDHQGSMPEPPSGVHLAPACRPTADGLPLLCW